MYNLQKNDLLKPKTRCNIKAIGDDDYYDFVVASVLESKFIVHALKKSCGHHWKANDKINVQIVSDLAVYEFSSVIISSINTNIPIYILEAPQHIKRIQRRQYVRYDYGLTLSFFPVDIKKDWKVIKPRIKVRTLNISGGGLCFTWSSPLPKNTLIALELPFDKSFFRKEIVIRALGEVKRCVEHNRKYIIGVEFREISERDRDKIIGFIFEQMRKDAKSKRLFSGNLPAFRSTFNLF